MSAPRNIDTELKHGMTSARPRPVALGMYWRYFGSLSSSNGRMTPMAPPMTSPQRAHGCNDSTPWASTSATPFHTWALGAGNRSVPSASGVGTRA